MSTRTEERQQLSPEPEPEPHASRGWSLDRVLAWRPPATPETLAYLAIFAVAFGLRFWDLAERAIHHDESLHATYSWYLYKGRGYEHHPLMHGPFLFHAMALVYLLFGVSDATARFVPAAFGNACGWPRCRAPPSSSSSSARCPRRCSPPPSRWR